MALDRLGLRLIAPHLKGAAVLCLGYPDITIKAEDLKAEYGIEAKEFTEHGGAHKVPHPLPETRHVMRLLGAELVDFVDSMPSRGVERKVDLNEEQEWPRHYDVVINPGTLEHCFDVARAMFNAWRALYVGGRILHVAPMTMMNHGFWNFSPTAIADFAAANGGKLLHMQARDKDWWAVSADPTKRFKAPAEAVLYALVQKAEILPDTIPTQGRFRA